LNEANNSQTIIRSLYLESMFNWLKGRRFDPS